MGQILLAAAAIAFVLNTFVIANSYIPSGSMENTIMTGDRIIGSRLSYAFGAQPQRGDIVLFDHKAEPGKDKTRLVKRIIGLPGETVDIRDNQIYINQSDTPWMSHIFRNPWTQRTIIPGSGRLLSHAG